MWRYLVGAAGALLLVTAGLFLFRGAAEQEVEAAAALPMPPSAEPTFAPEPLPSAAPEAPPKTREEKRFDRYDRDRDEVITREEYLRLRRRAFARLDTNGDGRLSFEEWAIRTTTRFAEADRDRSRTLTRAEFATTRTRSSRPRATPTACRCDDD